MANSGYLNLYQISGAYIVIDKLFSSFGEVSLMIEPIFATTLKQYKAKKKIVFLQKNEVVSHIDIDFFAKNDLLFQDMTK